jgi:hypothetical protein
MGYPSTILILIAILVLILGIENPLRVWAAGVLQEG